MPETARGIAVSQDAKTGQIPGQKVGSSMNEIIVGAASAIVGDKTGEVLYGKPHLETHGECLHADIHEMKDYLRKMVGDVKRKPIYDLVTLQPGVLVPMDKLNRFYSVAMVSAATAINFEVIGLGQAFSLTLQPGWNVLNMPDDTRWGLPSNAANNVGVVFCATDVLFGNAI